MQEGHYVLGLTQGDINGVGYELILRSLQDAQFMDSFIPVLYGSSRVVGFYRKLLNLPGEPLNVVQHASEARWHRLNVVECSAEEPTVELGQATRGSAQAAYDALRVSMDDWRHGDLDGIVTLPINKHAMSLVDFGFPGHTEYLESTTGRQESLMLLVAGELRVGLVTNHEPIVRVAPMITRERVGQKLGLLVESLKRDFGKENPNVAVLGLNPHAGEGGVIGKEEIEEIEPVIEQAVVQGALVSGPYAVDGFFGSGRWKEFDGVLAMYHDQGLAPFKALAFGAGVNFTAGLPLLRTSPDHGTAYELVGKGRASLQSFRDAVYLLLDLIRHREAYDVAVRTGHARQDGSMTQK